MYSSNIWTISPIWTTSFTNSRFGVKWSGCLSTKWKNWPSIDWSSQSLDITAEHDRSCRLASPENGITVTYLLHFWDKANHPQGWPTIPPRFTTEEEIQRFLEYVRFIVGHFKDRVHYFEAVE